MNPVFQDLIINVVGGLVVAVILWLLARLSGGAGRQTGRVPTIELSASKVSPRWLITASCTFAIVATVVDVFQPPPPFFPVVGSGFYLPDSQDMMFRARDIRERAREDSEQNLREAEREAEIIIERATELDGSLRAKGQAEAAQVALRVAERRSELVLQSAQEQVRETLAGADAAAKALESRAAASYGSVGEIVRTVPARLSSALGTFLRTVLIALLLASACAKWTRTGLDRSEIAGVVAIASAASLMTVVGFAIAAELLVPMVVAAVLYVGSLETSRSTIAILRDAIFRFRDHFGDALVASGTVVIVAVAAGFIGEGIDEVTQYLSRDRGWPIGSTYGAAAPTALIAFELARAVAGILFLQRLFFETASLANLDSIPA